MKNVKKFINSQSYKFFIIGWGLGLFVVGVAYSGGPFIILGVVTVVIGLLVASLEDEAK